MEINKKSLLFQKRDIVNLDFSEWSNPIVFAAISDFVEYLYQNPLLSDNINDAFDIISYIESLDLNDIEIIEAGDPTEYRQYLKIKQLIAKLYYVAFRQLTKEGLFLCLDKYLLELLLLKDLRYNFKVLLESFYEKDSTWRVREEVIKKIFDSESVIGEGVKINLGRGLEQIDPTIHNWILDYTSRSGKDAGSALGLVTYFNQSPNVANLTQQDVVVLKQLLQLYSFIKFNLEEPMEDPELILLNQKLSSIELEIEKKQLLLDKENTNPQEIVEEVVSESIDSVPTVTTTLEQPENSFNPEIVHVQYSEYMSLHSIVLKLDQTFTQKIGGDNSILLKFFSEEVTNKNIDAVHALLRIIARNNSFAQLLMMTHPLLSIFWNNLKELFGSDLLVVDQPSQINACHISIFLQWLFLTQLDLDPNKSVFIGVDIYNILTDRASEEYKRMIYVDASKKAFKWQRIKKGPNNTLIFG